MAWTHRFLITAALVLAACAGQPDATECATGITCPEGTKCAAAQPVCITNNCGDGVQQSTERCDDGNILDGDGCSADCRSSEICGDNVLNSAAGEVCDFGDTLGGDGCSADCRSIEICGNSIEDVGEACDDGNTVPGDGCSGNCRSKEICGNGIVDINEKCDDEGVPGGCNDDCQGGTGCGDGAIDKDGMGNPLEECDDGNTENQDDCTNLCHLNHCGDGVVQTSGTRVEGCDPFPDFGETMGCNLDCSVAGCGDGKINAALLEQCDDGNLINEDACKSDCKINVCGDAVEGGPNEACDTGGSSATCNADCTMIDCGDGFVNSAAGEDCDDGGVDTATCDANCTVPQCGDGTTNMVAGEDCDDMNAVETDDCLGTCVANACGDGFRDTVAPRTETCDDGNQITETACPYGTQSCTLCKNDCAMVLNLTGNVCGDTNISSGNEVCDDGNRVTEASCPYGTASCMVCAGDCKSQVARTGPFCGDGTTQASAGEACDDRNSMACGRCDAGCNVFASSAATGYIVASSGQVLQDNDTFTINDGFGLTVVFEFDKNSSGASAAGNIVIATTNSDTADSVHGKIRGAIDGVASFQVDAIDGGGNLVLLLHLHNSALGNQPITDTINTSDFIISGMSGGAGGNCANGVGCTHDDDCTSGNCNTTTNLCQ